MNPAKTMGVLLIIAGVLGLAFGELSFTRETHHAKLGSLALSLSEKENITIPVWASVLSIVAGAGLVIAGGKKK